MKGLLITFEGGEGAGKSTLMDRLFATLKAKGLDLIKTRAPGGTQVGSVIRNLLLNRDQAALATRAELFLFLADRAEHVEEVISPALKKGQIVLCDRFNDSTVAYQGAARGLGEDEVRKFCTFACNGVEPNLTLYLDLDPQIGLKRLQQVKDGKDKIETETLLFHQKIRKAFQQIATREPGRFRILDAARTADEVLKSALKSIDELFTSAR